MAVGLKASAFLECGATSLLLQCCCRAACVTTPPSTPLRGRGHTSSDKPTAANEKSSDRRCGVRSGCKYVVNPSRYPPHVLAAKLSRGSPAKRKKKIRDFPKRAPSPPAHHSLPLLSSLSLLCQRASHLSLPLSPVPHTLTLSALPPLTDVWLSPPLLETTFTFSPPSPLPPSPPQPNQSPRDSRPSPAQMAFVLLKLREEVYILHLPLSPLSPPLFSVSFPVCRFQHSLMATTVSISMQRIWCLRTHWDPTPGHSSEHKTSQTSPVNRIWPCLFQGLHSLLCSVDRLEGGSEDLLLSTTAGSAQDLQGCRVGEGRGSMEGQREAQGSMEHKREVREDMCIAV